MTDETPNPDETQPAPEDVNAADTARANVQAENEVSAFVQTREQVRGAIEPRDRLAAKITLPDPVRRESALPLNNRTILRDENIYQVLRYVIPTGDGVGSPDGYTKIFQVSGDHLYVAEINTSRTIYVKLGPVTNPWIRVQRGMTIKRTFDQVRVTTAETLAFANDPPLPNDDAIFYTSRGSLLEDEGSYTESTVTPVAFGGLITPGGLGFPQRLFDPMGALPAGRLTVGKVGGYIQVFNVDVANTMSVYSPLSPIGSAANMGGFILLPGQSVTIPLKGRVYDAGINDPGHIGWTVATVAGTCQYVVAVSSAETDTFDITGPRAGGLT